jgi:hypothetical protein
VESPLQGFFALLTDPSNDGTYLRVVGLNKALGQKGFEKCLLFALGALLPSL